MNRLRRMRRESIGFVIGSLCFAVASCPGYLGLVGANATSVTFFAGSIFFTAAAFIQLRLTGRWQRGAWKSPEDRDDWWSAAAQFIGTFIGAICFMLAALLVKPPGSSLPCDQT